MKLDKIDILILKFINKYSDISKSEILNKFPENNYSTMYRMEKLLKKEYRVAVRDIVFPIENSSYINEIYETSTDENTGISKNKPLSIYIITDLGKSTLQNLNFEKKENFKTNFYKFFLEFMRSIVCPIIVAIITTLIAIKFLK